MKIVITYLLFSLEFWPPALGSEEASPLCIPGGCIDPVYMELTPTEIQRFEEARSKRSVFYRSGKLLAQHVTETLDFLLFQQGYNKELRPPGESEWKESTEVEINMAVVSMGPIDETKEVFSLDCYFRQAWTDTRLRFNTTGVNELVLNWQFLNKIWKPDTVFLNGQKSFLHKITVPNRFIRVSPSGRVSYSQRLTIWARCPMYLWKFPFDSQSCLIEIGSYAYTAPDVTYKWSKSENMKANLKCRLPPPLRYKKDEKVKSALSLDSVELAQYHLKHWSHGVRTEPNNRKISSGFRNDTVAFIRFDLERQVGFFLMGIYFPLNLVVMCSWVGFWIVQTDVPSRVSLGVMSVLSVTKIWFSGKAKPQIGYATALDNYIIVCFAFSFSALIEFGIINFIDTYVKRLKKWEDENPHLAIERTRRLQSWLNKFEYKEQKSESEWTLMKILRRVLQVCWRNVTKVVGVKGNMLYDDTELVTIQIDQLARIIFPSAYCLANTYYWFYYVYVPD